MHDLGKAAKQKAEEVEKFHCNLADIKTEIECTSKHQIMLQKWKNEKNQKLQELETAIQKNEERLEKVKESGAEELAAADRSMEIIRRELANKTVEVTDRKVEREREAMAFQKLKAASDTEASQLQAELKELSDHHDQLTGQLTDASAKLAEEVDEGRKLQANAKVQADRLAEMEAEVDMLERRKCFMRSVMTMQRIRGESEIETLQEKLAVKRIKLEWVENELEDKKRKYGHVNGQ